MTNKAKATNPAGPRSAGSLELALTPEPWMQHARCTLASDVDFFPAPGDFPRDAILTCAACPVAAECLSYALQHDERFGVWGGTLGRQRRTRERAEQGRAENIATATRLLSARDESTAEHVAGRSRRDVLGDANRERISAAASVAVREVQAVLDRGDALSPLEHQVGILRVLHPYASLAEIAALADPPLSKNAVAGHLRRLRQRASGASLGVMGA